MGFRALLTAKPYHHASHKPSPSLKMSHSSHLQWQSAKLHSYLFRHCAIATEKMAILVNGFVLVLRQPFFNKALGGRRQISIRHFQGRQIENADVLPVNCVNMRRLVFFRLKEHLHDNPVKSSHFWLSFSFAIAQMFVFQN